MYKVLKEISEDVNQGKRVDSALSVGGRVGDPELKAKIAKQLGQSLQSLETTGMVDVKTGKINGKKAKKEKSPAQLALDELKKFQQKLLDLIIGFVLPDSFLEICLDMLFCPHAAKVEKGAQWNPEDHRWV